METLVLSGRHLFSVLVCVCFMMGPSIELIFYNRPSLFNVCLCQHHRPVITLLQFPYPLSVCASLSFLFFYYMLLCWLLLRDLWRFCQYFQPGLKWCRQNSWRPLSQRISFPPPPATHKHKQLRGWNVNSKNLKASQRIFVTSQETVQCGFSAVTVSGGGRGVSALPNLFTLALQFPDRLIIYQIISYFESIKHGGAGSETRQSQDQ